MFKLTCVIRFARKTSAVDPEEALAQQRRICRRIALNKGIPDLSLAACEVAQQVIGGQAGHPCALTLTTQTVAQFFGFVSRLAQPIHCGAQLSFGLA